MLSEPKTPALETSEECELRTQPRKASPIPSLERHITEAGQSACENQ